MLSILRGAGYAAGHNVAQGLAEGTTWVIDRALPAVAGLAETGIEKGKTVVDAVGHIAVYAADEVVAAIPQEKFDNVMNSLAVPAWWVLNAVDKVQALAADRRK